MCDFPLYNMIVKEESNTRVDISPNIIYILETVEVSERSLAAHLRLLPFQLFPIITVPLVACSSLLDRQFEVNHSAVSPLAV
jgi:hypothetical protein